MERSLPKLGGVHLAQAQAIAGPNKRLQTLTGESANTIAKHVEGIERGSKVRYSVPSAFGPLPESDKALERLRSRYTAAIGVEDIEITQVRYLRYLPR